MKPKEYKPFTDVSELYPISKEQTTKDYNEYTMETYLKNNLKIHLKQHIKGEVHCSIFYDTLIVIIYGANTVVYQYKRENISQEIEQGFTSEMVADKIVKAYSEYIYRLYFL